MAGRGGQPGSRNIGDYIQYVQDMIERCLQCYMSQQEAEQYLEIHFQIQSDITRIIWQRLEEENRDFFRSYHVNRSNFVQRQVDTRQQMQTANRDHPRRDSNAAPRDNVSAMSSASSAPNLQPDLSDAQRNIQPASVPVPNLQPEAPSQAGLIVTERDNVAVTVPASSSPSLQPDSNIATSYDQPAVAPDPRIPNQQHQVRPLPASSLPGDYQRLSREEVRRRYTEAVKRLMQRRGAPLQHGFRPSQGEPSNAPATVAPSMGYGNAAASALTGNMNIPRAKVEAASGGSIHGGRTNHSHQQQQQQEQQQEKQVNDAGLQMDQNSSVFIPDIDNRSGPNKKQKK